MLKAISVFVVLLYTSADCQQYRYDYSIYAKDVDGWFKYHKIPATWHDAWLRCKLEGAVLASPKNMQMSLAMRAIMKNKQTFRNGVFTGIHATFSKGDYFDIEGYPLERMPVEWMPMEPDNKNNKEECIFFVVNGTIADVDCNEVQPFMCFKKKTDDLQINGCGTTDNGYKLESRTGSCYKFHRVPRNWTRAFMTCASEGAHLAIINSETESSVLKDIFAQNPPDSIIASMRNDMRSIMHAGFHDWGEHGIFTTIDGKSLDEAGFNLWGGNQPDNAAPGEMCGSMFRNDGKLNDVWCKEKGPFICEKSPASLLNDENVA